MSPEKVRAGKNGKKDQIVLEKAETEELPPGWTKDVKIRKKGSRTRKDLYYKDPVTGCIFRSLKDVQRYLKTGEVGRLVIKPNHNSCVDMDTEDGNLPTQAGGDQMGGQQISSLDKMENDEKLIESTCTEDHMCVSENASEPCMEIGEVSGVNLPEANRSEEIEGKENASLRDVKLLEVRGLEEREEKSESEETMIVPAPSSGPNLRKRPLESGSIRCTKRSKSSEKSKSAIPRRASKRLAGIDVVVPPSPLPEPKTRRQATTRRARQAETSTAVDLATPKEHDEKVSTSREKQVNPILLSEVEFSTPEEHAGEVEKINKHGDKQESILPPASEHDRNADMDDKPSEKQEIPIILRPENLPTIKEGCEKVKEEHVKAAADEKHELPIVLPPVTPCTPKEHDKENEMDNRSKEKQESPTGLPPVRLTTPEEYNSNVKTDNNPPDENQGPPIVVTPVSLEIGKNNKLPVSLPCPEDSYGGVKTDIKPGLSVDFSLNDLWTDPCIEFAVKTLTGAIPIGDSNKADNFPTTSQLELSLEELWTDPCIEFAVKTLTGAIPVEHDLCVQDYLPNQPTNSSQTLGENYFSLPDICVNNFCQTEVWSKHYEMAENSLHNKQQDMVAPTMSPNHQRNGSLQNSGTSVLPQQVKGNSGQCSKPRFFQ